MWGQAWLLQVGLSSCRMSGGAGRRMDSLTPSASPSEKAQWPVSLLCQGLGGPWGLSRFNLKLSGNPQAQRQVTRTNTALSTQLPHDQEQTSLATC